MTSNEQSVGMQENGLIDTSQKTQDSEEKVNIKSKFDRNYVLDQIREHFPIDIYELKKKLGISYGVVYQIVREFEFCGLIEVEKITDENGNRHNIIKLAGGRR